MPILFGNPGADVSYTLTVTNTGNAESFNLTVSSTTWTTGVLPASVGPLAAGGSTTVTVTVSIPAGAAGGATDAATITATSAGNSTVSDWLGLTTTSGLVYWFIHLPLIMR